MPDLVARWKEIHKQLGDLGLGLEWELTPAQREDAASAILAAENPGVLIKVEDSSGGGVGTGRGGLYTVEGREGAMGGVKFSLDALRWELGPGGAKWPEWDTASGLQVVAKFEELSGKVHEVL